VRERGAIEAAEVPRLTGAPADPATVVGSWAVDPALRSRWEAEVSSALASFHDREPLAQGAPIEDVRAIVSGVIRGSGGRAARSLVDAAIEAMDHAGVVERAATTVRLAGHRVSLDAHDADVRRLLAEIGGDREATPPTMSELASSGVPRDVVDAAVEAGLAVRISREIVVAPALVERAAAIVRAAPAGITVSTFRATLGTSRKYAVPILEHFDRVGITRREGDLRFAR
jgi:selenocysteine-specific elongation factor